MTSQVKSLFVADEAATDQLGLKFAESLEKHVDQIREQGLNIRLNGDLGAGKTAFVRAVLRGLKYTKRVKSPTFTLLEPYSLPEFQVNHFDFYRFETPEEFEDAGFRDNFGPGQVTATEWTIKAEPYVPEADLVIAIEIEGDGRRFTFNALTELAQSLLKDI